jgi:hypothetical protein
MYRNTVLDAQQPKKSQNAGAFLAPQKISFLLARFGVCLFPQGSLL